MDDSLENVNRTAEPSLTFSVLGDPVPLIARLNKDQIATTLHHDRSVTAESDLPDLARHVWTAARETKTVIRSLLTARNSLEDVFLQAV